MDQNPFEGIPCRKCGAEALTLEWRPERVYAAKHLGTYSIAGAQNKTVCTEETWQWPWCVCANCEAECPGKK